MQVAGFSGTVRGPKTVSFNYDCQTAIIFTNKRGYLGTFRINREFNMMYVLGELNSTFYSLL